MDPALPGPCSPVFSDMPENITTLPIIRGRVTGTADPASLDTAKATLTRRASEHSAVIPLNSMDWAFAELQRERFSRHARSPKALPQTRVRPRLFV